MPTPRELEARHAFTSSLCFGNSRVGAVVLARIMSPLDRYTCEQLFRRMDDYLDRELVAGEMAQVRAHLETCAACAKEFAFEASVLQTLKAKLRRVSIPPRLRERIARRLSRYPRPAR